MKLNELTIKLAHERIRDKEISSLELTESCLDRIKGIDDEIGSFISMFEDDAIAQAKKADEKIANKNLDLFEWLFKTAR